MDVDTENKENMGKNLPNVPKRPEEKNHSIRIDLDGTGNAPCIKPRPALSGSLGRPPTIIKHSGTQDKPPQVRLCSDLARQGMMPAAMVFFFACLLCLMHSDEDHSLSAIGRSFAAMFQELSTSEGGLAVCIFIFGLILAVLASLAFAIAHSLPGGASVSKYDKDW
jgi:hypothetical protein